MCTLRIVKQENSEDVQSAALEMQLDAVLNKLV